MCEVVMLIAGKKTVLTVSKAAKSTTMTVVAKIRCRFSSLMRPSPASLGPLCFSRSGFFRFCAAVEAVADANAGFNAAATCAELLAQPADMHVERARFAVILHPPDSIKQLLARDDPSFIAREDGEQGELFARQFDRRALAGHAEVGVINAQVSVVVDGTGV